MPDHEPLSETERAFWHRSTSLTSSEGWRKAFKRALMDIDDLKAQARDASSAPVTLSCAGALGHIMAAGEEGMTVDELEVLSHSAHQTASARVHDLEARGDVYNTGKKRKTRSGRTAIVWHVTTDEAVE